MGLIPDTKYKNIGSIIGIDPGSITTGYSIFNANGELISHGAINLSVNSDLGERLIAVNKFVKDMIKSQLPSAISCENQYSGVNVQSLLTLREIVASIRMAAAEYGVDFFLFAPTTVKKTVTGSGKSNKDEVAEEVIKLFNLDPNEMTDRNVTDAIAIGLTYIRKLNKTQDELATEE